jgi:uncharacterized protein (DUF1501 family)
MSKQSISRRTLLATAAATSASMLLPMPAHAVTAKAVNTFDPERILIMIELNGGNDGLNTIIPYDVSAYHDKRPTTGYKLNSTSGINAGKLLAKHVLGSANYGSSGTTPLALNPVMDADANGNLLRAAWNAGDLAVLLGVGYSGSTLSHFNGMDNWNAGSPNNPTSNWVGRLMNLNNITKANSSIDAHGILLSRYSSNPLKHGNVTYLAMSSPSDFVNNSNGLSPLINKNASQSPYVQHLIKTHENILATRQLFADGFFTNGAYTPVTFSSATFDSGSDFQTRCRTTAEMVCSGKVKIPVYKIEIGGFDHHTNLVPRQEPLLLDVARGLANLRKAFIEKGIWNKVLIMTYSEFGRRIGENGSVGTDHGGANCHIVLGGQVDGGKFFGSQPSLSATDSRGNMIHSTNFQSYYAGIAHWMGLNTVNDTANGNGTGQAYLAGFSPLNFMKP